MTRKKLLVVVALALVLLATASTALGDAGEIQVFIDGSRISLDVPPRMVEGRLLVPVRGIFEALDARVEWDAATATVTAARGTGAVRLTAGKSTAYVNGRPVNLDVAPAVVDGRILVPLRFVGEALGLGVEWQDKEGAVYLATHGGQLPVVGSYEKLQELLKEAENAPVRMYGAGVMTEEAPQGGAVVRAPAEAPAAGLDYSTTNVQVAGVDEADIVKTDGEYIYQVTGKQVAVVRAYPPAEMQVVDTLQFDWPFTPQELYVDDRYMVVIGSGRDKEPVYRPQAPVAPQIYPPPPHVKTTVKAIIYDIADKEQIRQVREVELEGNYVSSRKIGPALYLVANRSINYYIMQEEGEDAAPSYRDTAKGQAFIQIDYPEIRYFPGFAIPNYLIVAGLNLERPGEEAHVATYLGAGENIYASLENLYVAVTGYEEIRPAPQPPSAPVPPAGHTAVYKFALDDGRTSYQGRGEVPGTVLNQFSMDEYRGCFRVATTVGEVWRTDDHPSRNNIYVLDKDLHTVGRLEDIAPGERIYSARFLGDRAYLVTFKKVDPFFVIDLADPQSPQVLGALKIPGYSDYLHPYDENHIIGFGKETVELAPEGWGRPGETTAFYQGLKMAIFDVSDVQHPVEMFKEVIGDRGTDAELLHNHKALLFSREKNLLAFPVTVMEIKDGAKVNPDGLPAYGEFTFQGAYIYQLDLDAGFTLRGRITHLTGEDYQKAGQARYDDEKNVVRVIYIDDTLYTISNAMIKAHRGDSLKEVGSVALK